jgi:2-oxoglutarate dehydrogenase E2 component (dihydrolipoamide succinyltransferase)
MAIEVTVPEMGESVLEATVSQWLKKEGDFVNVGDVLVELETDKVNVEVGAKSAGVLQQVKVQEGGDVKVGDVLATIDEKAQQTQSPAEPKPEAEKQPQPEAEAQPESEETKPVAAQATPKQEIQETPA